MTLSDTVAFTDPLGGTQSWSDPNAPTVTISNGPGLGWWYGNQESYLFPGVAGMSSQTTSFGYYLNNPANVTITVLNASNQVVKTIQSGVSESNYYDGVSWDGTDDQGQTVAPGQYTIDIDASNQGGESTLTTVRDVANPGSPGALTSPTNGATLSGTAGFVFTPSSTFPYTITEVDVNCIGSSYAPSSDGTWQGSGDTSGCQNGSVTLSDTVAFTDPLGGTQSWSDPNAPTVTISNGPGLGWWYGNQESYLFPGVAGMSSQTTSFGYYLNNPANVTITVLNASNQVVKTIQSGVSESNYYDGVSWDGTDDQGQTVAPGQYTIDIDASNQGGESTLTAVRDVANPGSPGALTSPTTDGTISGLAQFVFTPNQSFISRYPINEVDFCLSTGGCAVSYNPSVNGTWYATELTGDLTQGPATLTTTVDFSDPVRGSQSWSDAGRPVSVNTTALALQASLSSSRGVAPLATSLSIDASDPNGLPLTYTVNWGDGSSAATGTIDNPYPTVVLPHTFSAAGIDTVDISVSNGASGFSETQLNTTVLNPTLPIQLVPSPSSGTAPLSTTFTLTTSDVSGQPVNYDIAFGDGQATSGTIDSPYNPLTISHTYTSTGTFDAGATVSDAFGTAGSTVAVIKATGAVALQPSAGDDQVATVGQPVVLDGSGSQPSSSITAYSWSFGDGSSGTGAITSHTYASPGTYTAKLTITADGEQAKASSTVTVVSPSSGLHVTVNDGSSPLSGASVAVIADNGTRYQATTDNEGLAVIQGLPDGSYEVYAYEPGYLPGSGAAIQSGGTGSATISLEQGSVAQTSASSTELNEQQIIAAGINPNDPANQFVYQFSVNLAFDAGSTSQPVQVCGDLTGDGVVNPVITENGCGSSGGGGGGGGGGGWGLGGGGGGGGGSCELCFAVGPYQVTGQPSELDGEPSILWMIIPGQAQWLKEFFDVKMVVSNLTPTGSGFSFDNGTISLGSLPNGLSLAPTANPQSITQSVPDIPGGGSASADWILRGDAEGFYTVTGSYDGTLDPVGAALDLPISTATGAIHVWGGSAIQMIVDADDQANLGYPYLVRIGLENVADIPVYNPSVELSTQGSVNYIYQPDQQLTYSTDVIQPGGTFWTDYYRLVPEITGTLDLSQSFVKQTGGDVSGVVSTIESHPATPIDQVPTLTAGSEGGGVELQWQTPSVAGISDYQIFYTPSRDTPFSSTPVTTVSSSTLSTFLPDGSTSGFYAVSAVVDGTDTMYSPLVGVGGAISEGTIQSESTSGTSTSQSTVDLTHVASGTITMGAAESPQGQALQGFGVTLTSSSAALLESLGAESPSLLTQTLNSLFNTQTGAGISVIRLPMGANDFSVGAYGQPGSCASTVKKCPKGSAFYTYDDMPQANSANPFCSNPNQKTDPTLECFSVQPYDSAIIDIVKQALAINPDITIIASPWTAPPWMKIDDNDAAGAQTLTGAAGFEGKNENTLQSQYFQAYANYFLKYIQFYENQEGITINYVTPQNEPGNETSNYPGMYMNPSEENQFVYDYLSPALAGTSTKILDYDWNWPYQSSTPCETATTDECWTQSQIDQALQISPETRPSNLAGVAWHCYSGSSNVGSQLAFSGLLQVVDECSGFFTGTTTPANVANDSKTIVGSLDDGASAVQFYNLALNPSDGPHDGGCSDCRGVITIDPATGAITDNVEYWLLLETALAFSPGSTVTSTNDSNGKPLTRCESSSALCVAAATNTDGTVGLYVGNPTSKQKSFSVDDNGYGFSSSVPANSVISFRWTNPS